MLVLSTRGLRGGELRVEGRKIRPPVKLASLKYLSPEGQRHFHGPFTLPSGISVVPADL